MPIELAISRVCEEFQCLPMAALREIQEAPYNLIADIVDVRGFIRTKEALDRATPGSKIEPPTGPMADRVWDVIKALKDEHDEAHEEMLRR